MAPGFRLWNSSVKLNAWIFVETAPIDSFRCKVESGFEFDTVDIKSHTAFEIAASVLSFLASFMKAVSLAKRWLVAALCLLMLSLALVVTTMV